MASKIFLTKARNKRVMDNDTSNLSSKRMSLTKENSNNNVTQYITSVFSKNDPSNQCCANDTSYNTQTQSFWYNMCKKYEDEVCNGTKTKIKDFIQIHNLSDATFRRYRDKCRKGESIHPDQFRPERTSNNRSHIIDTNEHLFPACNHKMMGIHLQSNYEADRLLCPNCDVGIQSIVEQHKANENVINALLAKKDYHHFEVPDGVTRIKMCSFWDWVEENCKGKQKDLLKEVREMCPLEEGTLKVRFLNLDSSIKGGCPIPTQKDKDSIKGGYHPPNYKHDEKVVLSNPNDGSILVVCWPTKEQSKNAGKKAQQNNQEQQQKASYDFIVVDTLGLRNEDIVDVSKNQTQRISLLGKAKRSGAAGGYVVPTHNHLHDQLSTQNPACRHHRRFYRSKYSKSTLCKIEYVNPQTGKMTVFKSVYNDIRMTRSSKNAKKEMTIKEPSLKRKTLAEMEKRIRAMAIMFHFGLMRKEKDVVDTFLKTLEKVQDDHLNGLLQNSPFKCKSLYKHILLSWACITGEMRNNQALANHCDANKGNDLESLTMWGRVPDNDKRSATTVVANMTDGLLVMTLQGFAVRTRCGIDVIHCRLINTMHMPDRSRDDRNWSYVH